MAVSLGKGKSDRAASGKGGSRITRSDVARLAGVSLTTVTHALNPPPGARVSPATRDKVRRIARELGYRPSFVGRALVKGRSFTVGVLQPSHQHMFSGFYQQMLLGMVRAMETEDYHPLLLFRENEQRYLRVIAQGRVDAMIVLQSDPGTAHIQRVLDTGIPAVVVNKSIDVTPWPHAGCVHSDHDRLMREVVAEFTGMGCRTLLEVNDHRNCDANRAMFDAFVRETAALAGAGVSGATMIPAGRDFGRQVAGALAADQRWDGVFVDGTDYAETFLQEALRAGLQPGRDLHLISSSTREEETTATRLERAACNHRPCEVGLQAWRLLWRLLRGERPPAGERLVLVPYRRIPVTARESHHAQSGNSGGKRSA